MLKIRTFLQNPSPTIRKLASVVGSVISIFPTIPLGKLHYRALEKEKIPSLKEKCGNYESKILCLNNATEDLKWWLGAIPNDINNINTPQAGFEINTDASKTGWGARDGSNPTWGFWSENDEKYHINSLDLLALKHAVTIYEDVWKGCKHIKIKSDNTTAISYMNNMGVIVSYSCNYLSKTIWYYSINSLGKFGFTAVHIPGKDNETAGYISRLQNESTKWR